MRRTIVAAIAAVLLAAGAGAVPASAAPNDAGLPSGFKQGTGRCKGLLELKSVPGACTHGPDAAFPGLDVTTSVAPLSALAAAPASIVCDGDGQSGYRVQVLYIHGSG